MADKSAFNEHGSYLDGLDQDPAFLRARKLVDLAYQVLLESGYSNRDSSHILTDEIFGISVRDRAIGRRAGTKFHRPERLAQLRKELGLE